MLQTSQPPTTLSSSNSRSSYTMINYNQHSYRVNIQQLQNYHAVLLFWSVFCACFSLLCLGFIIEDLVTLNQLLIRNQGIFACSFTLLGSLIILAFIIKKRKFLGKLFIISSINLTILLISWLVMFCLKAKLFIIPTSSIIFIEILLSFIYLKNKSFIFGKILILGQFFLFALKIDDIIKCNWIASLFILIILTVMVLSAALFVGIFTIISSFLVNNLPVQKKCGFAFIGNICLCLSLNFSIPFYNLFFGVDFWIGALTALLFNIWTISFIYYFQIGIKVFFCKTEELKTFTQNIYLTQMKPTDLTKFKIQQISQNWYKKVKLNRRQRKKNISPPISSSMKNIKENHCLVCLQNPPEVIWIPCGHFSVCIECCQKMFNKKNACCVLCKMLPSQVYIIDNDEVKSEEKPKGMDNKEITKQKIVQCMCEQIKKNEITIEISGGSENDERSYRIKEGYKIQIM